MLTQKDVDKAVIDIVPEEYIPAYSDYVTSISCVSSHKTSSIRDAYYPDAPELPEGCFVGAITINLEAIIHDADLEVYDDCYKNKFSIFINCAIPTLEELHYVLLNQVAQVDLSVKWPETELDARLYADFYAMGQLKKIYGVDKARDLVDKYGSIVEE